MKTIFTLPLVGRLPASLALSQLAHCLTAQTALAQGRGGGGQGGANGNGGGNNGGGNGNSNGNGNNGGTGASGNANSRGKSSDVDANETGQPNSEGSPNPGGTMELRHANGITETLKRGRYSMRDNKGRVIIDRPATMKDRNRFRVPREG